jgi:hypothetical protein
LKNVQNIYNKNSLYSSSFENLQAIPLNIKSITPVALHELLPINSLNNHNPKGIPETIHNSFSQVINIRHTYKRHFTCQTPIKQTVKIFPSLLKMFKPSEIKTHAFQVVPTGVDMAKSIAKFETDDKQQLQMGKFKIDNKSSKLVLEGELTTNGIAENKWSNSATGKSVITYSLGIRLSDEDLEFFETTQTTLGTFAGENYELTSIIKNDIVYLKCKDKKVFNAMSNVKCDTLFHGQKVTVTVDFKFYINLKDQKAGLVLHPVKYIFSQETD